MVILLDIALKKGNARNTTVGYVQVNTTRTAMEDAAVRMINVSLPSQVISIPVITTSAPLTNAPTTKVDAVTTDATTSASNTTTEYQISITTVPIVTDSSTTATPNVLHCPTCTDDFVADCQQNAECTADEACMLQVTEGQLQTGCVEITDCEYNARIGTSICCKDKNCTDNAFRNFHDFIFTCPTCQNTPDPKSCMDTQWKCAYMNKGCMISLTTRGFTSGCNTNGTDCHQAQAANSALCNINPIPFGFNPDLQCSFCCHQNENTCIVNALGIHEITTPPEVTGSAVGSACFDIDDDTFNCKMFNTTYDLCAQTSGLLGHLVVTKCRKTCGVCTDGSLTTEGVSVATTGISVTNEGVSVAMTTTSGSVTTESVSVAMTTTNDSLTTEGVNVTMPTTSGSVTTEGVAMTTVSSPQPTTPMPCIDHDVNNNCDLMRDVLCHANDPHIMNYAVATCAETCDLCAEYLQHLSGLVVTP
ncbi:hypothetical protein KP79_PYT03690 [Mizuhopecten yessoensis]|uniref:ShKT domain-containing protein n=1 Tax=Mizuhopecten yessoensis TaxID=6573 RepID=A0A210PSP9_MIZYE|nr:hypothetical protein KP79_PYT03690 [Mizuhopecten yessoensis]